MPVRSTPGLCRLLALGLVALVAGCDETDEAAPAEARPVRVVVVEERATGETASLAGTIESQVEADLAFRIGGRMTERDVAVGDTVAAGPVLARPTRRTVSGRPRRISPRPRRSFPRRARTSIASGSSTIAAFSRGRGWNGPRRR
jgi:hypothetical protein